MHLHERHPTRGLWVGTQGTSHPTREWKGDGSAPGWFRKSGLAVGGGSG